MLTDEIISKRKVLREFARYMVGRYRLGYTYLALYWASVLFEQIVNLKLQEQDPELYNKIIKSREQNNLYSKLSCFSTATLEADTLWRYHGVLFKDYLDVYQGKLFCGELIRIEDVRTRLDNFRFLRNLVMHESSVEIPDDKPNNTLEFVYYVWSELAPDSFARAFEKWVKQSGRSLINTLHETTADYMVRAVDETLVEHDVASFAGITYSHFDNLFDLRNTLAGLQKELALWLPINSPHLTTDILTTIDTTSGYIWMPLVPIEKARDEKRQGIYNVSVSILATPLDLRIYLDFGGWAKLEREQFYRFLKSASYESFRKEYAHDGDFKVFDIDWYSALLNVRTLEDWVTARDADLQLARDKQADLAEDAPATWNRLLHGYILSKLSMDGADLIDFMLIVKRLQPVIELHQAFLAFCQTENQS